ncbi:MAG: hypothetical protein EP347_05880 [Alphaproteobacteria bacterium]|nr:MAG: hypothetical protein EP347_05880 [Alphaproteobacteria bacterium]
MITPEGRQQAEIGKERWWRFAIPFAAASTLLMLMTEPVISNELELGGSISLEYRHFPHRAQWQGQDNKTFTTLIFEPEMNWERSDWRFFAMPSVRSKLKPESTSEVEISELYFKWSGDQTYVQAGIIKIFWGVAESRHLVDVINQWDMSADIDGEDKIGQAALVISRATNIGNFDFLYLPVFRDRKFPTQQERLRPSISIRPSIAVYDGQYENDWRNDFAIRYAGYFGSWDVGLHYFNGLGRDPRLIPIEEGVALAPTYVKLRQMGIDLQYTGDKTLLKLEGVWRNENGQENVALVTGLEHTLFGIGGGSTDIGLVIEYLYDGRREDGIDVPIEPLDNDLFFGTRFAVNDVQDTALLVGFMKDLSNSSLIGAFEFERRIGSRWKLEIEGRWFDDVSDADPLTVYQDDSNITTRLAWYF